MGNHQVNSCQGDWWCSVPATSATAPLAPCHSSMEGVVQPSVVQPSSPRAQDNSSRPMDSSRPSWMHTGSMDGLLGVERCTSPFPSFGLQIGGEEIDMAMFKDEPDTAPGSPLISNFFNDAPLHEQSAQLLGPPIKAEEGW